MSRPTTHAVQPSQNRAAIEEMVAAIKAQPKFSKMVDYSVTCLLGMAIDAPSAEYIVSSGAIEAVMKAINQQPNNPQMPVLLSKMVSRCTKTPELAYAVAAHMKGDYSGLASALSNAPDAEVVMEPLRAIAALSQSSVVAAALVGVGEAPMYEDVSNPSNPSNPPNPPYPAESPTSRSVGGSPRPHSPTTGTHPVGSPTAGSRSIGSPTAGTRSIGSPTAGSRSIGSPRTQSRSINPAAGGSGNRYLERINSGLGNSSSNRKSNSNSNKSAAVVPPSSPRTTAAIAAANNQIAATAAGLPAVSTGLKLSRSFSGNAILNGNGSVSPRSGGGGGGGVVVGGGGDTTRNLNDNVHAEGPIDLGSNNSRKNNLTIVINDNSNGSGGSGGIGVGSGVGNGGVGSGVGNGVGNGVSELDSGVNGSTTIGGPGSILDALEIAASRFSEHREAMAVVAEVSGRLAAVPGVATVLTAQRHQGPSLVQMVLKCVGNNMNYLPLVRGGAAVVRGLATSADAVSQATNPQGVLEKIKRMQGLELLVNALETNPYDEDITADATAALETLTGESDMANALTAVSTVGILSTNNPASPHLSQSILFDANQAHAASTVASLLLVEENRANFFASGGVYPMVALLQSANPDAMDENAKRMILAASRSLGRAGAENEVRIYEIMKQGGTKALANVAKVHIKDPDIVEAAISSLDMMQSRVENVKYMAKLGTLETAMTALELHSGHEPLTKAVVQHLAGYAAYPETGTMLLLKPSTGTMRSPAESLVEVIRLHSANSSLVMAAVSTLGALACSEEYVLKLMEAGVLEGLVAAVQTQPSNPEVLSATLALLDTMSLLPDAAERLNAIEAPRVMKEVLSRPGALPAEATATAKRLIDTLKEQVPPPPPELKGVDLAVSVLSGATLLDEDTSKAVNNLYSLLAADENRATFVTSDGLPILVSVLHTAISQPTLDQNGAAIIADSCRALARASNGQEDTIYQIMQCGGAEMLVSAVRSHPNNASVCESALLAMNHMFTRAENVQYFHQIGAIEAAVQAWCANPSDEVLGRVLLDLFGGFAAHEDTLALLLTNTKNDLPAPIEVMVDIINFNATNAEVMLSAVMAVGALANSEDHLRRVVECGALEAVVRVLDEHSDNQQLVMATVELLETAMLLPENGGLLYSLGTCETLEKLEHKYTNAPQAETIKNLRRVVMGHQQLLEEDQLPPPKIHVERCNSAVFDDDEEDPVAILSSNSLSKKKKSPSSSKKNSRKNRPDEEEGDDEELARLRALVEQQLEEQKLKQEMEDSLARLQEEEEEKGRSRQERKERKEKKERRTRTQANWSQFEIEIVPPPPEHPHEPPSAPPLHDEPPKKREIHHKAKARSMEVSDEVTKGILLPRAAGRLQKTRSPSPGKQAFELAHLQSLLQSTETASVQQPKRAPLKKSARELFEPEGFTRKWIDLDPRVKEFLCSGMLLKRHYDSGPPKGRHVFMTDDCKYICWKDPKLPLSVAQRIQVKDMVGVERGRTTPRLSRKRLGKYITKEDCCFAISGSVQVKGKVLRSEEFKGQHVERKTVDFECFFGSDCTKWVEALKHLMEWDRQFTWSRQTITMMTEMPVL